MPITMAAPAPAPTPVPAPRPEPWSWTVDQLMAILTSAQRQTVLARLRVKGYPVTTWVDPAGVS